MSEKRGFRITTAWCSESGENPWLVSAYDEFTEDTWNGTPDLFSEAVGNVDGDVRIIDILVDYDAIEERFSASTIIAAIPPSLSTEEKKK